MDDMFPHTEALVGISQVSIVFAGFAGISVVLSRRLPEQWTYGEAVRMACMIESSITAAFFALLPIVIIAFGVSITATVSASGLLFAIAMFVHMVANGVRIKRAYEQDPEDMLPIAFRASMLIIGVAVLLALVLSSFNIVFQGSFGPYLAGLLFHLAFSSLMFMRSLTLVRETARTNSG